jgi:DNA-binding XRE family transcriptional regulator
MSNKIKDTTLDLILKRQVALKRPRRRDKSAVNHIARKLTDERIKKGYTQEDLARGAEVSLQTIKRFEMGAEGIALKNILKIMNFLLLEAEFHKSKFHSEGNGE